MDRNWMRERLEKYVTLCREYDRQYERAAFSFPPHVKQIASQINAEIPTVKEIVKQLDSNLVSDAASPLTDSVSRATGAVEQALGILRDQDEWKVRLAPDAPSLLADQFHPNVWTAASAIWDTGQYRVAVLQGAVALSAHIAAKAGSSLTERELAAFVFAPADPTAGRARLHFPGDKAHKTWRSRQDGLHQLAQGAFAGIRNVATHTNDEWTEQMALEYLAVLSVVARWTDETELVK